MKPLLIGCLLTNLRMHGEVVSLSLNEAIDRARLRQCRCRRGT